MNNVQLITKFATEAWDKVYKKDAISSILDGEKDLLQFTGVRTVKIAKFSSDGLGDYQRANYPTAGNFGGDGHSTGMAVGQGYGYPQGDVSLVWEEFTLRCDRAKQLRISLFDNEETGELLVGATMKDFSRTKVVPEIDAYVFSKLAEYAGHISRSTLSLATGGTPAPIGYNANGPVAALNAAFLALADAEVPEEDQVIFCSNAFWAMLQNTNELVRTLRQNEYKENVSFTISQYLGRDIIAVPESRFRTLISLNANGYSWDTGSEKIDFIVCAKSAVYHVTKYDKVKVFQPNVVQDFDGYKVNVRVYHDVFVPDNKRVAIYAHVSEGTAPVPTIKFIDTIKDGLHTLSSVAVVPGDLMIDSLRLIAEDHGNAPEIGTAVTDLNGIAVGAYVPFALPASEEEETYYLCGIRGGTIVAVSSDTIVG